MKIAMAGFSAAPVLEGNHARTLTRIHVSRIVRYYGRYHAGFGSNNLFQQIQNLPARMPPR